MVSLYYRQKSQPIINYLLLDIRCSTETDRVVIIMSWEEWFGFPCDPFDPKPLQTGEQFRDLLVRTKPIVERVEPLLNQIDKEAFCKAVLGDRGIGKSTVLRYCTYLAAKKMAIPVFVQFHPAGIAKAKHPIFETLIEIMTQIIQQEITNLYEMQPKTFNKYRATLMKAAKYVGLDWQEIEGFYKDPFATPPLDEKLLRSILWSVLEFTQQDDVRSVIAIDNLDKMPFEVAKEFLGGMTAQPLFEHLIEMGCSIFVAIDPHLEERIRVESDLSYLGERIQLASLSPSESANLVRERIRLGCGKIEKAQTITVDDELITRVCNERKGNTREILKEFSRLFQAAYERRTRHLSLDLYDKPAPKISSTVYYEMIERNSEAKKGAEKVLYLMPQLRTDEIPQAQNFLLELYKGRQIRVTPNILKKLYDGDIIIAGKGPSSFRLHPEIDELFKESSNAGIDPKELVSWIVSKDTITTVKPRYPTFRSKRLIKHALEIQANSQRKTGKVTLLLGTGSKAESVQWIFEEHYDKSVRFLKAAAAYYESFELREWEDTNAVDAQHKVYFTMLNFLLAFSYYNVLFSKTPVRAKDQTYWPLILAVLGEVQKTYTPLKSFPSILQIRQKQYNMKQGSFQPTLDDINRELQDLEDILVDLVKIWDIMSKPHITSNQQLVKELESIQERLIEMANENGWLGVHADEKFDLVGSRTQDLVGYKKRPQYLFIKIKMGNPPEERDFLDFFSNAEGIISEYEKEVYSKDFLRPTFNLWFISTVGFKQWPKPPKLSAPRNRIRVKHLHKEDLETCFKKLNLADFLELDSDLLDIEDVEKFQELQEDYFMKSPKDAANEALDYFETKMRKTVKVMLQYHFDDEWFTNSTVPMKQEIEERLAEDEAKVPATAGSKADPLSFIYISDLRDIILKKDNWNECFGIVFKRNEQLRDQFRTRMDEIQDMRNKIKHAHEIGESFAYTEPQIQRTLQDMLWILAYFDQYREVIDIFDQNKSVNVEERNAGKLVSLGRICGVISKEDANEFDRKVKNLVGQDVYRSGGSVVLKLENSEELFNLSRKKLVLLLVLCRKNGIASIFRRSFNEYKINFQARSSF